MDARWCYFSVAFSFCFAFATRMSWRIRSASMCMHAFTIQAALAGSHDVLLQRSHRHFSWSCSYLELTSGCFWSLMGRTFVVEAQLTRAIQKACQAQHAFPCLIAATQNSQIDCFPTCSRRTVATAKRLEMWNVEPCRRHSCCVFCIVLRSWGPATPL